MSDEPLFTLRELAGRLSLPESTVRYYRDAFLDHIPSVGTGRRRRYPEPALAVLRTIARGYASGRTRTEILGLLEGVAPIAAAEAVAPPLKQARRARAHDTTEVTNLDLLAAIVDGEREQREALWQMAQEIVRLTQVLETQEKVLGEISEHTGMPLSAPEPRSYLAAEAETPPALGRGSAPEPLSYLAGDVGRPPALGQGSAPEPEPAPPSATATEQVPLAPPPPAAALPAEPSDIERLREELGAERALVDRLREAKLKLERRTTEAEEAIAETRARQRTSVLGRLLKSDRNDS
jgi:DNA-binding transcriptional MerR regulator